MATENAAKRLKTDAPSSSSSSPITIGTHSGHFHADEALAVYLLRQLPAYSGAGLVRTRDPARLAACHTVVDVGGEYDAARHRYDHHQRGFDTKFPGRTATRLSSAGLVWLHFGRDIIAQHLQRLRDSGSGNKPSSEESSSSSGTDADADADADVDVDVLHPKLYESFFEAVDANDNGVSAYDPAALAAAGIEKRFSTGAYSLGALVGRLNPNWNDALPSDPAEAQAAEDERFLAASARIGEEFARDLDYYARSWLPARAIVRAAYDARRRHDPSGRVLVLEGQAVPWKDHLYTLEEQEQEQEQEQEGEKENEKENESKKVLYVLYPEKPTPDAKWRIQAVAVTHDSFQSRKALPEPWRGARDAQLDEVAGLAVPGAVFVHASGFIGGHQTFEGAMEMAAKACAF